VDGRRYIDGNSSWWVAGLGHGHPRLVAAMKRQAETLVHCALAGIAHEQAAALAEELVAIAPGGGPVASGAARLDRVFYVDDGSTAIDAAAKMCVQARRQLGQPNKTRFLALDGAFHGDTVGATSLGGVEVFRRLYAGVTFECVHAPVPEERSHERAFAAMKALVTEGADTITAVFVEPVVQGAAGMRVYDPRFLEELRALCDAHDVWLVADEVFTGYGRTGPMWACDHAGVSPDILCIGKAFASLLPMAAVLVNGKVFDAFGGGRDRAFLHGHTFCGHALGAAVAREVLAVYRDEDVLGKVARSAPVIAQAFERIAAMPGVERVRTIGMIGAADLADGAKGYLGGIGWRVYEEAKKRGAYLRPPLVIEPGDLAELLGILEDSVKAATR
jgi:adenosylmethionine-8-amino-7-oxononanoate aminotransferase